MGKKRGKGKDVSSLDFDPKERLEFVKGFGKRKQERKDQLLEKKKAMEREMRILLRKKRKEAKEKNFQINTASE